MDKDAIQSGIRRIHDEYGPWTYDIPLPFGLWTNGREGLPHTRLKRIVQVLSDVLAKPLRECRVLDLASLDGMFPIEFAQQGCETVGVELREQNYRKAVFAAEAIGLPNLDLRQGDVREISETSYGRFDAIVCSGILYHLTADAALDLVKRMFDMTDHAVVIDTQISLDAATTVASGRRKYAGRLFAEHGANDSASTKASRTWASTDNEDSFWFTRPSLVNVLADVGFTSVYECFTPTHRNFGQSGSPMKDRVTFVAIKGKPVALVTSPAANSHVEHWGEGELTYAPGLKAGIKRKLLGRA